MFALFTAKEYPFRIQFISDDYEQEMESAFATKGFKIKYTQTAC